MIKKIVPYIHTYIHVHVNIHVSIERGKLLKLENKKQTDIAKRDILTYLRPLRSIHEL